MLEVSLKVIYILLPSSSQLDSFTSEEKEKWNYALTESRFSSCLTDLFKDLCSVLTAVVPLEHDYSAKEWADVTCLPPAPAPPPSASPQRTDVPIDLDPTQTQSLPSFSYSTHTRVGHLRHSDWTVLGELLHSLLSVVAEGCSPHVAVTDGEPGSQSGSQSGDAGEEWSLVMCGDLRTRSSEGFMFESFKRTGLLDLVFRSPVLDAYQAVLQAQALDRASSLMGYRYLS